MYGGQHEHGGKHCAIPMQIKEAKPYEVPVVVGMARRVYEWATGRSDFNEGVSAAAWIRMVQNGEGVVFVINDWQGFPIGFICGYRQQNIDTGKWSAQMWHWWVSKEAKGYGAHLLRRFEGWARAKDCATTKIGCLSRLWDKRHEQIYERMGYKMDGMNFVKEN